jgi:rhomboid protease GluP
MPGGLELRAREMLGRFAPHAATTAFVALSVGVYIGLVASSGFSFAPSTSAALRWGVLAGRLGLIEPWRFLSAMFVHLGFFHFLFNTLALHSLGRSAESAMGSARFTVIFLGSGIAGFIVSQLWSAPYVITGGISGGIFGLLGAAAGWRFAQGDPAWKRDAISAVGYAVVMALLFRSQINHAAHGGGLISGALIAWALHRSGGRGRPGRLLRGTAATLVALTFISIALSLASDAPRFRGIH